MERLLLPVRQQLGGGAGSWPAQHLGLLRREWRKATVRKALPSAWAVGGRSAREAGSIPAEARIAFLANTARKSHCAAVLRARCSVLHDRAEGVPTDAFFCGKGCGECCHEWAALAGKTAVPYRTLEVHGTGNAHSAEADIALALRPVSTGFPVLPCAGGGRALGEERRREGRRRRRTA